MQKRVGLVLMAALMIGGGASVAFASDSPTIGVTQTTGPSVQSHEPEVLVRRFVSEVDAARDISGDSPYHARQNFLKQFQILAAVGLSARFPRKTLRQFGWTTASPSRMIAG